MIFKLLLVEDDSEIREIITDYFIEKSNGLIDMYCAETGMEGQLKCMNNEYDLVLLDVMLPEVDGFTICRELRKTSDVPIIFITARHNGNDRVVDNHIKKLRKALGNASLQIKTIFKKCYKLEAE